jgi:hypothetical protein
VIAGEQEKVVVQLLLAASLAAATVSVVLTLHGEQREVQEGYTWPLQRLEDG